MVDLPMTSPLKQNQMLRAIDIIQKNKTINVFSNNEEKSLSQRIRDLNMLHYDLSPTNMVAYSQLPENNMNSHRGEYTDEDREAYINVTINEDSNKRKNSVFKQF